MRDGERGRVAATRGQAAGERGDRPGATVLVAGDDRRAVESAALALRARGDDALPATGLAAAMALLARDPPWPLDALVTDLDLGRRGGGAALAAAARATRWPRLAVVFVAGPAALPRLPVGSPAAQGGPGRALWLRRPYDLVELDAVLGRALGRTVATAEEAVPAQDGPPGATPGAGMTDAAGADPAGPGGILVAPAVAASVPGTTATGRPAAVRPARAAQPGRPAPASPEPRRAGTAAPRARGTGAAERSRPGHGNAGCMGGPPPPRAAIPPTATTAATPAAPQARRRAAAAAAVASAAVAAAPAGSDRGRCGGAAAGSSARRALRPGMG